MDITFEEFVERTHNLPPTEKERLAWIHFSKVVNDRGLMKPRKGRFILKSTILGATSLEITRRLLLSTKASDALFLGAGAAVVSTQIALLAHALGHKQVVRNENILVPLEIFYGAFILGISPSWWNDKHNRHHEEPNRIGKDPDLNVSVAVLSTKQGLAGRNSLQLFLIEHEYILPGFFTLQAVNARWSSLKYLLKNNPPHRTAELGGVLTSLALYVAFMLYLKRQGLIFALTHQALHGVYNSWIFASNHKMDLKLAENDPKLGPFGKQVLTSSDVDLHGFKWLISLIQNGLDEQIAHHLKQNAPIENLKEIRRIAKRYTDYLGMEWSTLTPVGVVRGLMQELTEVSRWAQRQKGQRSLA